MKIIRKAEFDISKDQHHQITELYNICFSKNLSRSYFKQLPHFRYLVFEQDLLIAQMGVDYRVIRVGDCVFSIFGVIDLCVEASYRKQGIASNLLTRLTQLAQTKSIDFLFCVSHSDSIYLKNGFQAVSQPSSWLGIDEHKNCGVITETIEENFMIKQIGEQPWRKGEIDLLGYMF